MFFVEISLRAWKNLISYFYNQNVSPFADDLHRIDWGPDFYFSK